MQLKFERLLKYEQGAMSDEQLAQNVHRRTCEDFKTFQHKMPMFVV